MADVTIKGVTIKDVAEAAGVGIATVSRVVHGHPSVSPEMKARVDLAVETLGYVPNPSAQAMRTRSSRTIGCAIRDIAIPEFGAFVRAAERVIRAAGYTLVLANTDQAIEQELELIRLWSRRRVDGLLLTKSVESDAAVNAALEKASIPVVFIDRDASPAADAVVVDHRGAMRASVDHLVSLGHRRIALLTGRPTMRPGYERLEGFRDALAAHGIEASPALVSARSFFAEDAFRDASLMLDARPAPTAIIAGGMSMLPGVLRATSLRGLRVGRDLSVIAGSDSDLAELTSPPITAVRWDVQAWGRMSAQLLLERIASPKIPAGRQLILPTELVIRLSCAPPQSADAAGSVRRG